MVEVLERSDILSVECGIICHQVNCIGVMGAGLALQIKKKWPQVFREYQQDCKCFEKNQALMLGHVQDILVKEGLVVANCFGQVRPGHGLMTDYKAWDMVFDKLTDLSNFFSLDLHFPWKIGCGLAGGDWDAMKAKIDKAFGQSRACRVWIHCLGRAC